MNLVYKFPLNASKAQITAFRKQLDIHGKLYNRALLQKVEQYEKTKKSDSAFTQIKSLVPEFRGQGCNISSLQQTIRRLHKAYNTIYNRRGGKPRISTNFTTIEYSTRGDGWQIIKDEKVSRLRLQFIEGLIEIKNHREFPSEPKNLIVKLKDGELWGCFVCEQIPEKREKGKTIALDFGLKTFITSSSGDTYEHPLPYKQKLGKFQKLQKKIRAIEDEKLKKKKYKILRKVHEKVKNQRADFLHKLSRKLVNENSVIIVEDLNFKKLSRESPGSFISRKYGDVACGEFYRMLSYKAESAGRQFVKVNPAYTSQNCCVCGVGNESDYKKKDRAYKCKCGNSLDRDINAAKNILKLGLESLDLGKNSFSTLGLQSLVRA